MEYTEKTVFEIWLENEQALGNYPNGFDPDLYEM